jgi:hypothetical protein
MIKLWHHVRLYGQRERDAGLSAPRGTLRQGFVKTIGSRKEIVVEAAGVELYNPLILRKLLVLQEAKSARNASSPGRRYKNGTNLSSKLETS